MIIEENIIMDENMIMIKDPKILIGQDVDQNLKDEIEFIVKSNESLAENKVKNQTEQLLLKYEHGNDIHEHGKQHSK